MKNHQFYQIMMLLNLVLCFQVKNPTVAILFMVLVGVNFICFVASYFIKDK